MNRLSRLLPVCRLGCNNQLKPRTVNPLYLVLQNQQRNYAELPRIKRPGEGKGPITWKTLKYIAVGGAVMFGALKYLEAQKDAGKIENNRRRKECKN